MTTQFLFTLQPVLADIGGGLFLFVGLAIVVTVLRLLSTAVSKVSSKGPEKEPAVKPVTLADGSYNWTGKGAAKRTKKPAHAATMPSPAQGSVESVAADNPEAAVITSEPGIAAHCTNCGAETGAGWKFCRECGQALD